MFSYPTLVGKLLGTQGALSHIAAFASLNRCTGYGVFSGYFRKRRFFSPFSKKYSSTRSVFKSFLRIPRKRSLAWSRLLDVTLRDIQKRLQGRLCKTLKRYKYDSVVACEQALFLEKEFAPRPKDCSQVTALGLPMTASPPYYVRLIFRKPRSVFVRPHEKRQSGVYKNMPSEDRFQKICVFGDPKRLFCVAFSAPDPVGLSMRTRARLFKSWITLSTG